MSLVKGPFQIKWGDNVITDVESIEVTHEVATEDYTTLGGRTIQIDGAFKVGAVITLLASDIPALAAVLPQYFVPDGGILSTGETVAHADGAIDIVPQDCSSDDVTNPLDIISCASLANVARIVDARTQIEGYEVDNKIQKVKIKFIGEAASDVATMQFFRQGTIHTVS